jgi:hypothetical protein
MTTSLHVVAPISLPICVLAYRSNPTANTSSERPPGLGPYVRRSIGLLLFHPGPHRLPDGQEPTTTCQPSDGRATFRMPKSIRRFAHHQMLSSGCCRPSTLTSNLSLNVYYQHSTNTPQTGGCTWRLPRTSTAFPFAVRLRRDTARRRLVTPVLARPTVALFTCMPFDITS